MVPKKRSKCRKKIIISSSVGIVIGLVALIFVAAIWNQKRQTASGEKQAAKVSEESSTENSIVYNGKRYVYNEHLSNYLFMGIDTKGSMENAEMENSGQADAIFLVSMDRVTKKIQVLSIPRDTMTEIEAFSVSGKSLGLMKNHINLQYAQGDGKTKSCTLMEEAVSNLLDGVPIQGYCSINMDGLPIMTELVGNVEIIVPDDSLSDVNPEFTEGEKVILTKDNVEQFVRYRDIQKEQSALVRQDRQKIFIQAYAKKAQEQYGKDPSFIAGLYKELQDYMVTNISNDVFVKMLTASQEIQPVVTTIPGEGAKGDYFDEYHVNQDELQELLLSIFYEEDN